MIIYIYIYTHVCVLAVYMIKLPGVQRAMMARTTSATGATMLLERAWRPTVL